MLLKPTTTTLEEVVARLEGIKNHQTSWIPTFVKITFLASSVFLASLELFKWFRRAPA